MGKIIFSFIVSVCLGMNSAWAETGAESEVVGTATTEASTSQYAAGQSMEDIDPTSQSSESGDSAGPLPEGNTLVKTVGSVTYDGIVSAGHDKIVEVIQTCGNTLDNYETATRARAALATSNLNRDDVGMLDSYSEGKSAISDAKAALAIPAQACGFGALGKGLFSRAKDSNKCRQAVTYPATDPPAELVEEYNRALIAINHNLTLCNAQMSIYRTKVATAFTKVQDVAGQLKKGVNIVKMIAGGALVAGVGYKVIKNKKDKKKKKKAAAKAKKEYEDGVLTLEDGSKLECFSTENYQSDDCRDTMRRLCSSNKKDKSGCQAFNGFYCGAGSGNENNSYCMAAEANSYCSGPGDVLQTSPACKWVKSRPAVCADNPGNINCLSSMSSAQLAEVCGSFPNDPLCKRSSQGIIVSQPNINQNPQLLPDVGNSVEGESSLNDIVGARGTASNGVDLYQNNTQTLQNLYNSGLLEGGP